MINYNSCYYCISLHVCPGEIFILDSRLDNFLGKKQFFWLSACSVLIVVRCFKRFFSLGVLDERC